MHAECSLERIYGGVDEASTIISATVCLWMFEVKEQQLAILGNHWSRVGWPSSTFAQRNHNATICTNGLRAIFFSTR